MSAAVPPETSEIHCYRVPSSAGLVAIVCTGFFALVGIASVLAASLNIDGSFADPNLAAACLGVFWLLWFLAGIWLILHRRKYRLLTGPAFVRQIKVCSQQQADLPEVDRLQWNSRPRGGSVRLTGRFGVLKIRLGDFDSTDRQRLIDFLRLSVIAERQDNWEEFTVRFRDTVEQRQQRQRLKLLLLSALLAHAVVFLLLWTFGHGDQYLVISVLNAVVGARQLQVWNDERRRSEPAAS